MYSYKRFIAWSLLILMTINTCLPVELVNGLSLEQTTPTDNTVDTVVDTNTPTDTTSVPSKDMLENYSKPFMPVYNQPNTWKGMFKNYTTMIDS